MGAGLVNVWNKNFTVLCLVSFSILQVGAKWAEVGNELLWSRVQFFKPFTQK